MDLRDYKILSIGSFSGISNTCLHRHWALKKISNSVVAINTSPNIKSSIWYRIAYHLFQYGLPIRLPENNSENEQIIEHIKRTHYDIIWIDKGITIFPETLKFIKKHSPQSKIISYSPDNMALRHNQSQQYLQCVPLYDCIITNKSYIIEQMRELGAHNIHFVNNSYEPTFHYPRDITEEERLKLGGDVGFIGAWEKERCNSILYLADHKIKVRVFGDSKWHAYKNYSPYLTIENHGLYNEDYPKSLKAFKICLCFLRKINYDQQTTRSVEIPACGGFMMAERTKEHQNMFKEGKEAEFFSNDQELLKKCQFYLTHDKERLDIAKAGYLRCITSNYSNEGMIRNILQSLDIQ